MAIFKKPPLMMNDDVRKEFALRFTKQSLYHLKKRCWLTNAEEIFGWSSSFNDVLPISKATDGNLSKPPVIYEKSLNEIISGFQWALSV